MNAFENVKQLNAARHASDAMEKENQEVCRKIRNLRKITEKEGDNAE